MGLWRGGLGLAAKAGEETAVGEFEDAFDAGVICAGEEGR